MELVEAELDRWRRFSPLDARGVRGRDCSSEFRLSLSEMALLTVAASPRGLDRDAVLDEDRRSPVFGETPKVEDLRGVTKDSVTSSATGTSISTMSALAKEGQLTVADLLQRPILQTVEPAGFADLHPPTSNMPQHSLLGLFDLLSAARSRWKYGLEGLGIDLEQNSGNQCLLSAQRNWSRLT